MSVDHLAASSAARTVALSVDWTVVHWAGRKAGPMEHPMVERLVGRWAAWMAEPLAVHLVANSVERMAAVLAALLVGR